MSGFPQHLLYGSLEDKRVGGYVVIDGQSPHKETCHCQRVKRPWQSQSSEAIPIIKPHPNPLLIKEREQKNVLSPRERVREMADLGGLEDKKVGGYAVIGEHSSHEIIFPRPVWERENFLANTSEHRNSGEGYYDNNKNRIDINITHPLYSPPLKGGDGYCLKRTYSPKLVSLFTHHCPLRRKAAFTLAEDATRVAMPNSQRQAAFTLAEVLITLGIIGVVAAMTLPALISKYQMKVFETAFKKQYSVLQNAINYTVLEEGISACYIYHPTGNIAYQFEVSDCEQLRDKLISLLQLKPFTRSSKYTLAGKNDVLANGGKSVNGNCSYDAVAANNDSYFTKDGAIILFPNSGSPVYIIIDVNGEKGPNKWGYDVFFMTFSNHNAYGSQEQRIFLSDEFCSLVEKGGRLPRTILQNKEKTEDDDFTKLWN